MSKKRRLLVFCMFNVKTRGEQINIYPLKSLRSAQNKYAAGWFVFEVFAHGHHKQFACESEEERFEIMHLVHGGDLY